METRILGFVPRHRLHQKRHSSIRVDTYNLWRHKGFEAHGCRLAPALTRELSGFGSGLRESSTGMH